MPIPVKCETCSYTGHAADSESGKIAKCPRCKGLIKVEDINWSPPDFGKVELPPFVAPLVEAAPLPAELPKPKPKPAPTPEEPPKPIELEDVYYKLEECLSFLKQAAFFLMIIMFLSFVSCAESCQRMTGNQPVKVEIVDRGF